MHLLHGSQACASDLLPPSLQDLPRLRTAGEQEIEHREVRDEVSPELRVHELRGVHGKGLDARPAEQAFIEVLPCRTEGEKPVRLQAAAEADQQLGARPARIRFGKQEQPRRDAE